MAGKSWAHIYGELRTVLDAVLMDTLRHVMEDKNPAERKRRANDLIDYYKKEVLPRVGGIPKGGATAESEGMAVMSLGAPGPGSCGDGYYNCYGVCVPYLCADLEKDEF